MRFNRSEMTIFSLAFLLRVVALMALITISSTNNFDFPIIGSDARLYIEGAESITNHARFLYKDFGTPMDYILPGYPFFIATVTAIWRSPLAISIVQIILSALSAVLLFRLASKISVKVGWAAGILFALDPAGLFYSNVVLSETLFIFLALVALNLFYTSPKWLFASGLVIGISILVRPAGVVLAPALLAAYWLKHDKNLKTFASQALLIIVGVSLPVMPWLIRNQIFFDRFELSQVASYQYYNAQAPYFYAFKNNISQREAEEIFRKRLEAASPYGDAITLPNSPYMRQVAFDYIGEHPIEFAKFYIVKTIPLFFSDGLRDIATRINIISDDPPNLTSALLKGDIDALKESIKQDRTSSALFATGFLVWFGIMFLVAVGSLASFKYKSHIKSLMLFSLLVLIFSSLIAGGAVSHPRYRHSISPFIFILASTGFWLILDFARQKWLNRQHAQ
jgi:hypothetical protein